MVVSNQQRGFPMAEFKYLDIDCAAWVRDTHHLRPVERGIYMDLIMLAWSLPKCRLPNDPKWIAKRLVYLPEEIPIMRDVVRQFWAADKRKKWLTQKRLDKEWKASGLRREHSLGSAKARWNKEKKRVSNARTVTETVTDLVSDDNVYKFRGGNNGRSRQPVSDEFLARLAESIDRNRQRK